MAKKKGKSKKEDSGILLPLLTTLLVIVGIGEAALLAYIGINLVPWALGQSSLEATALPSEQQAQAMAPTPTPAAAPTSYPEPQPEQDTGGAPPEDTVELGPEPTPKQAQESVSQAESAGQTQAQSNAETAGTSQTAGNSSPYQEEYGTIYITPTGERYHYDSNCNNGTYIPSTLQEALQKGLTPCQKCVLN